MILNDTLPEGVDIKVSSDDAVFIEGALHEVQVALSSPLVVVVFIIYLFLLDWRATIVPAIAMPIALLGAVAGIYIAGFSLNILTLLALVLATGLVVDDAIVVLENIVRRKHMGAGPRAAAVLGTQEVFFAVVATTLTLAAVFLPLSFLGGQTGRLFREFGFTLAIAVLLSSIVALTHGPDDRLALPQGMTKHGARPLMAALSAPSAGPLPGFIAPPCAWRCTIPSSSCWSPCCSPPPPISSMAICARKSPRPRTARRSRCASPCPIPSASILPAPS